MSTRCLFLTSSPPRLSISNRLHELDIGWTSSGFKGRSRRGWAHLRWIMPENMWSTSPKYSMFALVLFTESNSAAVVPTTWISGNLCWWPSGREANNATKYARLQMSPKKEWEQHEIQLKSLYATYDEGRRHEKKYEDTSNVDTDEETMGRGRRGRKRQRKSSQSSSDDEQDSLEHLKKSLNLPNLPTVEGAGCSTSIEVDNLVEPVEDNMVLAENPKSSTVLTNVSSNQGNPHKSAKLSILKEINLLKLMMRDFSMQMSTMMSTLNSLVDLQTSAPSHGSNEITFAVTLPVQSPEDLRLLEDQLKDESAKENLCGFLAKTGGINLGNLVRMLLQRLLTNQVALLYSWMGARDKQAFCHLSISRIIFDAVRRNSMYKTATDSEIENVIKDWLRHAKARNKNQ